MTTVKTFKKITIVDIRSLLESVNKYRALKSKSNYIIDTIHKPGKDSVVYSLWLMSNDKTKRIKILGPAKANIIHAYLLGYLRASR